MTGGNPLNLRNLVKFSSFVHINNTDEKCFLQAIACHFIGGKYGYPKSPTIYNEYAEKNFKYDESDFPMDIQNIHKFEEKNKKMKMIINVFFIDPQFGVFPAYSSKTNYDINDSNIINLLFTKNPDGGGHFFYIKNLSHFFSQTYNPGNGARKTYQKVFFCQRCFSKFYVLSNFVEHQKDCNLDSRQKVSILKTPVKFKQSTMKANTRLVGFLDFEAANKRIPCTICKEIKCECEAINQPTTISYKDNLLFVSIFWLLTLMKKK